MTKVTDIAIVGAGPYGLSVAAHLAAQGADFRIFGEPLDTWRRHMPQGMCLKSDGFASSLSAPAKGSTYGDYCARNGIRYHDTDVPVPLDHFIAYGLEFQQKYVPNLERRSVTHLEKSPAGYRLTLDDGEVLEARRVVLAIGITHFDMTPDILKGTPGITHASEHNGGGGFEGREVTLIGGGSSAVELAFQLREAGAKPRIVMRKGYIKFRSEPTGKPPSLWFRIRHPSSGLGPSLRSKLCCDAPDLFRLLPAKARLELVRRHLGPSSPWYLRREIEGKVEVMTGHALAGAEAAGERVRLHLTSPDGAPVAIETDHVISATGYRADLARLAFIEEGLRAGLRSAGGSPELSSGFESSAPGLYFVGNAAAASFGPLMRFMFGADFAARRVSSRLVRTAR